MPEFVHAGENPVAAPERPLDRHGQARHRIGLGEEIGRAILHRLDRHVDVAVSGRKYHGYLGVEFAQSREELDTVHARQPDVADHHTGKFGREDAERRLRLAMGLDRVALEFERLCDTRAQRVVILDQQSMGRNPVQRGEVEQSLGAGTFLAGFPPCEPFGRYAQPQGDVRPRHAGPAARRLQGVFYFFHTAASGRKILRKV